MSGGTEQDQAMMRLALRCAEEAAAAEEVPVGAVAADESGNVLAQGCNQVEQLKLASAHAEMLVLQKASEVRGDWRMEDVTVYVTKEPCAMCAGALVNARVKRVVYGMPDPRSGAAGSALNITAFPGMLHQVEVTGGVLEEECRELFRKFFKRIREKHA